ncbi:MAG: CoB--CoM heterodisulfide reductase iron-sulfur subunit A family protein [Candidatus Thermoplasmatota archaeon]
MPRVGVFVCHCGVNIAQNVDVDEVTRYAEGLKDVVVSKNYKYLCSDAGGSLIKEAIKEYNLDAVVVASCSPRMHEHTFQGVAEKSGLNKYRVEIANIREHCSWVHNNRVEATGKAKALVRMAVAKARHMEDLEPSRIKVVPEALVIGGGVAGIQSALDLADEGFKVYLVEREPTIGGRMAQLDKTFPTLDCASCILTPKMMEVANHPQIELLTYSEVESVKGSIGEYTVRVRKKPRYVDTGKCTGCGDCASACRLKGRVKNDFDMGLGKRGAVYVPFAQAVPLKYVIDDKSCLYLTRGRCGDEPLCVKACKQGAIDFKQKEEIVEFKVGVIIVATGYDLLGSECLYEMGYGVSSDVITTLELERLISSSGPTKGEILKPSNNEKPRSVTFVLCVGSRDKALCEYCCRVGCMTALKQMYLLREKFGDSVEINMCYTDIRSYGKGYEEFYRRIRGLNVNMFRGRPSEVRVKGDVLKVDVFDTLTDKLFEVVTDLVVLVPGIVPSKGTVEISRLLRLSRSADGFLLEAHPKLRPMDTFISGVFLAGCCQGPKDIQDTVAHASGAASRAAMILSSDTLEALPYTAVVDEDLCSGCKTCVGVCPYQAIETLVKSVDGKKIVRASVNTVLCQGCGCCVVACPSRAIDQLGFKDEQIRPMIKEF